MHYSFEGKELFCKEKVAYNEKFKVLYIKLLYELQEGHSIIEKEYQDFPIKLYDNQYISNMIKQIGFNFVEKIKNKSSDDKISILKCKKL